MPYASPNLTESQVCVASRLLNSKISFQAPHSGVSEMQSFRPPMFDGGMGGLQGYSALPVQVLWFSLS